MPPTPGCPHCWPPSPDAAWAARSRLERAREVVDESHFHVMILACRACGQRFVSVFTETIDWADGEDPQSWTLLPLSREEAEGLARARSVEPRDLEALGPGRRSLRFDHPKGEPSRIYWATGCAVVPHD